MTRIKFWAAFLKSEKSGGLVLMICAVASLVASMAAHARNLFHLASFCFGQYRCCCATNTWPGFNILE